MTEHTALPLGYFKSKESRFFQAETWAITGPDHDQEEAWDIIADGIAEEDTARFIVTACNNYEQVREVLKYIDDYENIDINHVKATVRRAICQVEEQTKRPVPKRITPDIVPLDDGGLAQKAQPPPKDGNLY